MKDKIEFENYRIDWASFVKGSSYLQKDFQSWINARKPKIKSKNRLYYIYLRYKFGIKWIRFVQEHKIENYKKFQAVLHYDWILHPVED